MLHLEFGRYAAYIWPAYIVSVGVISSTGLVDAALLQATDSSGTGAKAIGSGVAITQLSQAGGNSSKQCLLQTGTGAMDTANGFTFIALRITPSVAAALISGELFGEDVKYLPADGHNNASLIQIVG